MSASVIAIIPARGGSKRVPRKNVRKMLDRPLIAYTIEAALRSGIFAQVVVSTDCPEIAAAARAEGAEVPFMRKSTLADDITPVSAPTVDMLVKLDPAGGRYAQVCQLMANCPLRDAGDITSSYRQFIETGAPSQISVMHYGWQNPWWAMRRDDQFTLDPLFEEAIGARSQDLVELFCPTGAVWWARADVLRRERTYHVARRTGWEIDWQHGMDIDTEDDWTMAEMLMELARQKASRVAD